MVRELRFEKGFWDMGLESAAALLNKYKALCFDARKIDLSARTRNR
jgi:hypothetical protein